MQRTAVNTWKITLAIGLVVGAVGCDFEPEDGVGQGLSASAGDATSDTGPVDDTVDGIGTTSGGPGPSEATTDEDSSTGSEPGSTSGEPQTGSTGGWDGWDGSSSGDGWGSGSSSGSSGDGFLETCTQHLDAVSCGVEAGCAWINASEQGVCIEDFGGDAGDLCGFLDAELCEVLDECAWDAESNTCTAV